MKERGFTLIELVVVMAVLAILTGIMVPVVYQLWEDNEKELTQKRLADLKKAIVGDPDLKQNGVRTDFGFVGNCGQLPGFKAHPVFSGQEALSHDLINPDNVIWQASCVNKSPYLSAGFNASTYNYDAWGNEFVYIIDSLDSAGRRLSGRVISAGPDRKLNSGDDISIAIDVNEVAPAQKTSGMITLTFSSPPIANLSYSTKVTLEALDAWGGNITVTCPCVPVTIGGWGWTTSSSGNTQVNYTVPFSDCFFSSRLTVGKIRAWAEVFQDATCTTVKAGGLPSVFTINDRQDVLLMNLQVSPVPNP